jgi:putative hemolysin
MRRFKSFLLILCALWLPLQAATAVAMPFCSHAGEPAAQVEAAQASDHCHEQGGAAGKSTASDLGCDNCGMCHLTSAGYIPPATVPLPAPVASALVAKQLLASRSFIAEPPRHPPRPLS